MTELVLLLELLETLLVVSGLVKALGKEIVSFPVPIQAPVCPLPLNQLRVTEDLEAEGGPVSFWDPSEDPQGPPTPVSRLDKPNLSSKRT